MRRVGIAAALVLACSSVPPESTPPVELCRSAIPDDSSGGSEVAGWLLMPVLYPLMLILGPERLLDWLGSLRSESAERRHAQRELDLLNRAAEQGHLPSLYLLATESSSLRGGQPPLERLLLEAEERATFLDLADAGFAPGEVAAASEAAREGFVASAEYYHASRRWQFFELATRAALRGSRP